MGPTFNLLHIHNQFAPLQLLNSLSFLQNMFLDLSSRTKWLRKFLHPLFCFTDIYFCFSASIMPFLLLLLYTITWSQILGFLLCFSCCTGLLLILGISSSSTWILRLFPLLLWIMLLVFCLRLHWVYSWSLWLCMCTLEEIDPFQSLETGFDKERPSSFSPFIDSVCSLHPSELLGELT